VKRLLLLFVAAAACTDADLYVPPAVLERVLDDRLALSGSFCAEGASDLDAYLKIMLVVDRSNSMIVSDPQNRRVDAARELVMRFVEDPASFKLRAGVEIAVVSFFGNVVVHSRDERGLPGFSTDGPQILFSITQLAQTSSNTGYDKALAQAFTILDSDMARLADEAKRLSRYEVLFVSDGMPFPDNCRGETNAPSSAVAAVGRIKALQALHRVPIRLHSVYLADPAVFTTPLNIFQFQSTTGERCDEYDPRADPFAPNAPSLGEVTRRLLDDMASTGGGTFVQFNTGDVINFAGFEFADARRIFALAHFVVSNTSSVPEMDHVLADSDGDWLTDAEEIAIGTSPHLADSDGDYFRDGIEWRYRLTGFDPLDPTDARCPDVSAIDPDGDGLLDCEEVLLGTRRNRYDSDFDGMPDQLELAFGTNAVSANSLQDLHNDADADGGSDADEVRWHMDPNLDDVARRSKLAYIYDQRELPITTGQACYDFQVSNVALASTTTAPMEMSADGSVAPPGWNRVMLYFAQTPYDDPLGEPLYRVACVDARYVQERDLKFPASGRLQIPSRRPSDTYRAAPVLRPDSPVCQAAVNQDCGLNTYWCRFEDDGTCGCFRPPQNQAEFTSNPDGFGPFPCPPCADGIDNDGDGFTDYPFDRDCFDSMDGFGGTGNGEQPVDECSNGLDDDGDNLVDFPGDPGCTGGHDATEGPNPDPLPTCANGVDDDLDGAADFPTDPGCFAASDGDEAQSVTNPVPGCNDGVDNDGDGLVDLADAGCFDAIDIDEDGPAACFFCERGSDLRPGQCDLGAGYCRPRSGPQGCRDSRDCRSGVCNTTTGECRGCLEDSDCASGVCDVRSGWCLLETWTPSACASDADCTAGTCDTNVGFCRIDPLYGCRDGGDCHPGDLCSGDRGWCLTPIFATRQCAGSSECAAGECDTSIGWCLPSEGSEQRCRHDDECPFGNCVSGHCDQQTFVFPEQFRSEVDCLRAR
jgi:hypothetical protein